MHTDFRFDLLRDQYKGKNVEREAASAVVSVETLTLSIFIVRDSDVHIQ